MNQIESRMKTYSLLNCCLRAFPNRTGWLAMLLLAAWAVLTPQLTAAPNLIWDVTPGTTGAQDGSGTWNAGNLNWWDASTSTDVIWNTASNALFGAGSGSGTVTLGGSITAFSLQFNATGGTNYLIAGGGNTLTISSGGSLNISSGVSPVISANISATAGNTTINGPGTLNQIGNYDATGQQFTIGSGTLNFSGTTLNASKLIMSGGGTIRLPIRLT